MRFAILPAAIFWTLAPTLASAAANVFSPYGFATDYGMITHGTYSYNWFDASYDLVASGSAIADCEAVPQTGGGGGRRTGIRFESDGSITQLRTAAGYRMSFVIDGNRLGQSVGVTETELEFGNLPTKPLLWDAQGNLTVLPLLDDPRPTACGQATSINDHGVIVGGVTRPLQTGTISDFSPVRWDSPAAPPVALERPESGNCIATRINNAGMIVGMSFNWTALRWQPNSTAMEVLEKDGFYSEVMSLNDRGVAVGMTSSGAARWNPDSTALIHLDSVDETFDVPQFAEARSVNLAGEVVGISTGFTLGTQVSNYRAVKWAPDSTALVTLPLPILDELGIIPFSTKAFQNNDRGFAVGTARPTDDPQAWLRDDHAILWTPEGEAIDLNSLLAAGSPWTLNVAYGISDDNWITGLGSYNGQPYLPFMIHFPEPTTGMLLLAAAVRRRRPLTETSA